MSSGDTSVESAKTEPVEAVVLGDASSRNLRHTLQRNNMERSMCQRQTRHLDSQRKNIRCKLDREERELRHQLHRLQEEQKVLTRLDSLQDEYILQGVSHANLPTCSTEDVTSVTEPDVDVINPYPVALRRHAPSGDEKEDCQAATPGGPGRPYHSRRRVSVEFEDLELQTSTGKIFPPLQGGSRRPLALGLHASISMVTLVPEGSTSGSPKEKERDFLWVGAPEAIQSVRRPRKSVSRQRLENLVAKSATYREHGGSKCVLPGAGQGCSASAVSDQQVRDNLRRCSSLKESRRRGGARLHSATSGSGGCSRSGSWKEGRGRRALLAAESVENVQEAFTHLDIGAHSGGSSSTGGDRSPRSRRYGGRTPLLSRQSSACSLRDYTATPETKSCVWGTVTCLDISPEAATHHYTTTPGTTATSSLLLRRHGRKKSQPEVPSLPPISASTEAATSKPPVSSPLTSSPRGAERGATPRFTCKSREGSFKKKT